MIGRDARMPRPAGALVIVAAGFLLGGCVTREHFVPPPPPAPLRVVMPPAAALPTEPLTVDEAVRIALERNPDLRVAAARVAEAQARLAETEATFWPHLGAEVSFLRADAPSAYLFKRIDAHALPASADFNDTPSFSNLEAGLTLRWNLWRGGRDQLGRWAADADIGIAQLGRDAVANALAAAVVAACLDARAASELLATDDASVRAVEAQVAESRVKVEGGAALRSDLLSLEVRLAEARQQRVRTAIARRLALATLRELLALPADASLVLADAAYDAGPLPETAAQALTEAYRRRPETFAARRAVERAQIDLATAERAYLPRLDLESRLYGDDAEVRLEPGDPNWTVAVALSVELLDGGARAAGVRRARAALDDLTESDRKALLLVAREVETAYLRLEEARARLAVAVQAVGAAEESLELVSVQYRGGAATVTRFLEAEAARMRARTARIQAELDVSRAAVEARRAMGWLAGASAWGGEG